MADFFILKPLQIALLLLLAAIVYPYGVHGQASDFRVHPTRLVLDNEEFTTLNVTNTGNRTLNFRLETKHMAMSEEGRLQTLGEEAEAQPWMLGNYLRFGPRQFSLPPGERRIIRIATRFTSEEPDGEYRAHIAVHNMGSDEDEQTTTGSGEGLRLGLRFTQALGIPIIARKGELAIPEVNISRSELIREQEQDLLRLRVEMQGRRSVIGRFEVSYEEPGSGESQQVGLVSGAAIYADSPARFVNIPLDLSEVPDNATLDIRYTGEENEQPHTFATGSIRLQQP